MYLVVCVLTRITLQLTSTNIKVPSPYTVDKRYNSLKHTVFYHDEKKMSKLTFTIVLDDSADKGCLLDQATCSLMSGSGNLHLPGANSLRTT